MGAIVKFPRRRHARASVGCESANVSKVISDVPFFSAKRTKSGQRRGGMPRLRHELTVEARSPSSVDTGPVPPSASIAESDVSIAGTIVRTVRTCQEFATRETTFDADCGPIGYMASRLYDPPEVIGPRLLALREALEITSQVDFAKSIGVAKNTYNPWETGTRQLTFSGALKIRKKYRVPLEYLFFGQFVEELPAHIRHKLRLAA